LAGAVFVLTAPAAHAAPTILLLHGGGWQSGDGSSMAAWGEDFRAHGYRTVVVDYPLRRVTRSMDYAAGVARVKAQDGEPVIAYGISAGGTIAAMLAATGVVDGAVNVIGPTDFTRWYSPVGIAIMLAANMSQAEKTSASPYLRLAGQQSPQLLQCGIVDPVTPYDQCTRYVAAASQANTDTQLQSMTNAHGQSVADRARARNWIKERWPAAKRSGKRAITTTLQRQRLHA